MVGRMVMRPTMENFLHDNIFRYTIGMLITQIYKIPFTPYT